MIDNIMNKANGLEKKHVVLFCETKKRLPIGGIPSFVPFVTLKNCFVSKAMNINVRLEL